MSDTQQTGIYSALGRIAHSLALPLMRPLIRRTERVYVLIEHDGKVLLIKNWFGRQDWHLPGGGKRRGETEYETAVREVQEEIGVLLPHDDLKSLTKGIWRTDSLGFKYSILSIGLKSKPKISMNKPEILDATWWQLKDQEIPAPPEIQQAIKWFYKSAAEKPR
jgi:8-oxo-dGTP pyrophosphatase MutT (NUDIX family)